MAVNYLYISGVSTVFSFVGLQWWVFQLIDEIKSDGLISGDEINSDNARHVLELILRSNRTVVLSINFVLNVFVLVILSLKTIFFGQLYPSEMRKVLERLIGYLIYKGTFLPLIVPPNTFQTVLWSSWLIILCCLKMFQSLARDRLERLNASPTTTPPKYFRVYSTFILVIIADILWIRLCISLYRSFSTYLSLLLFFEPLSIAFETLQAMMVHGFQIIEIWQRHSADCDVSCFDSITLFKSTSGSLSEWKGMLIRNCGFLLDMLSLSMAICHYIVVLWLRGMAFHLIDAVLFLNFRALLGATVKRIRGYVKLRKALNSLDGALPDATYEELSAFNDECAICRGPMSRAKKLSCNHLFHLACLRSWLDQGATDVYSCPTCRRPLFVSNSLNHRNSVPAQGSSSVPDQPNIGIEQQRALEHAMPAGIYPNQQSNASDDAMWRGVGFDPNWTPPWPTPVTDIAGTSNSIRSVGFSGVRMMMRQLTSVGQGYSHGSLDNNGTWNLWPPTQQNAGSSSSLSPPSSSSVPPPSSSSLRFNRNGNNLRFRSTSSLINGEAQNIREMVDRVREVLPHIPDEVIIEDLLRTNNINLTVNNLLLVQ